MAISEKANTPIVRIGTVGSLIVTCYRSTPTADSLDDNERIQMALLEQFPKVATIAIAGPNTSLIRIDDKVRVRSVEMAKKFEGKVRGAAIVIATKGLSAVMARSFMTAYLLLSKQAWPMQTFPSIVAASHWLEKLPGNDVVVTAAELEAFERGE
ncbi:MAG: hypothetical protein JNM17_34760 [Archangium sp.]|nr:hypothetical protein [Archangium sp.]